ncbi:MAG: 6-hydroxymethylpterin diphosphokinase MptE-like protein [bacterium]
MNLEIKQAEKRAYYVELPESRENIHSTSDPIRETERRFPDNWRNNRRFIIMGAGLGYVLQKIQRQHPEPRALVFEPHPELLVQGQEMNLWEKDQFDDFQLIDPNQQDIVEQLAEFVSLEQIQTTITIPWPKYQQQRKNYFEPVLERLESLKQFYRNNLRFLQNNGKQWLENTRNNLKYIMNSHKIKTESLDGPVAIVAPGPSLDRQMEWLRTNREQLIVISTNTAGPCLEKQDIPVDLHVAYDADPIVLEDLKQCSINRLLFNPIVDPQIPAQIEAPLSFMGVKTEISNWISTADFLNQFTGSSAITPTLMYWLDSRNVSPIYLLGCDFGSRFGRIYARGTYREQHRLRHVNRFSTLANWHIKNVSTSEGKLLSQRQWLNTLMQNSRSFSIPQPVPENWTGKVAPAVVDGEAGSIPFQKTNQREVKNWSENQIKHLEGLRHEKQATPEWNQFYYWLEAIYDDPKTKLTKWIKAFENLVKEME